MSEQGSMTLEVGGPGTQMARAEEVTVPAGPVDMARIVALAESGVDPDTIGRMVDLYERVHGIQAKQAFNEAMANVRAYMDAHPVKARGRNKVTKNGTTVPYVLLEDIQRTLAPPCTDNGLRYSFDTEPSSHGVVVLVHVHHIMGHSETTRTAPLPIDTSGSKNATQGVGSTESYGMRYGLIKAFGLVRYLHDDDGGGGADPDPDTVDDDQLANLQAVWDEVKANVDEKAFLAYYDIENLAAMPAARYAEALGQLQRRRK